MTGDPDAAAPDPRGVVAFDNAGTLSGTSVVRTDLSPDADWATPVPAASPDRGTVALLAVDDGAIDTLRTDDPLGPTVARADVPVHLALANRDVTPERARAALVAADGVPARVVPEQVDRVSGADGRPAGAQVVVLVDAGRAARAVGYTTTPKPAARDAVEWARSAGFEPHIVSGDGAAALRAVADAVGVAPDAVHAYQSTDEKRRTIERLGESVPGPVVMVGNGPNDRRAFAAADAAVLVAPDDRPDSPDWLTSPVDAVVPELGALPDALDLRAVAARGAGSGRG